MSGPYTVRPWPVSGRIYRTETGTSADYPWSRSAYWNAEVTYNDGSRKVLGSFYDGDTGYPRRGGSGKGAAYVACTVALGYSKPSDRELRTLFAPGGLTTLERPEGERARTVPTGRERMRRLGIRPDVTLRPDMTARERYTVAYRKARLQERGYHPGPSETALHKAARAMVPRFRRIAWGSDERNTPRGAAIGGYVVLRPGKRGERDTRWCYNPSPGETALRYYLESGSRQFVGSYRRHLAHLRSWWRRLPDPETMTTYYGDKIADYQEGRRTLTGEIIYPIRKAE